MRDKGLAISAGLLLVCVVALFSLSDYKQVPLTATTGSELSITANPTAIPAIGGVSTITVTGFKSADDGGGPLSNGTQIFFTTNVGQIEQRVEMTNGVAHGFLRGDGRASLATVEARSGAGITATLANPVLIGNAQGINILVTATPATVTPPDFTSQIVATVFDNDNNPLSGVPLVFSTTAGALASQSSILRTNQLGQAADRLTLENETSATVTATSGTVTASTTVTRGTINAPIVASLSPTIVDRDTTESVTITGLNFQPGAVVSFGEGVAVDAVNFVKFHDAGGDRHHRLIGYHWNSDRHRYQPGWTEWLAGWRVPCWQSANNHWSQSTDGRDGHQHPLPDYWSQFRARGICDVQRDGGHRGYRHCGGWSGREHYRPGSEHHKHCGWAAERNCNQPGWWKRHASQCF